MIVFSSVNKQFIPDTYALKDISFEIGVGELVLFTGPSGSGKTTLMKLLTKEYLPTDGEISFNNISLNEIKNSLVHEHRRKIGVVFQDYKLIPELNIWENIALPLSIIGKKESEIEQRVTDLLELVSLSDKAMHFPKQLSGGEAQRISIARALSTGPSVIFADEPTGNLDRENSLLIAKLIEKINSLGTTVLFATHDHDVLDLMSDHRHIILEDGKITKDTGSKIAKEKPVKDQKTVTEEKKEEPESKGDSDDSEKTKKLEEIKEEVVPKQKKQGFFSRLFAKKQPKKKITLKDDTNVEDKDKDTNETVSENKMETEKKEEKNKTKEDSKATDKKPKEQKSKSTTANKTKKKSKKNKS